jgi:hypothetical protein
MATGPPPIKLEDVRQQDAQAQAAESPITAAAKQAASGGGRKSVKPVAISNGEAAGMS